MIATPTDKLGRYWLAIWRDMAEACKRLDTTIPAKQRKREIYFREAVKGYTHAS